MRGGKFAMQRQIDMREQKTQDGKRLYEEKTKKVSITTRNNNEQSIDLNSDLEFTTGYFCCFLIIRPLLALTLAVLMLLWESVAKEFEGNS